jgi:hypothetical protein
MRQSSDCRFFTAVFGQPFLFGAECPKLLRSRRSLVIWEGRVLADYPRLDTHISGVSHALGTATLSRSRSFMQAVEVRHILTMSVRSNSDYYS